MKEKGKTFFKQNQFVFLMIVLGCTFLTIMNRWDLYEKPVAKLCMEIHGFLGMESQAHDGGFQNEEAPLGNPDGGVGDPEPGNPGEEGEVGERPGESNSDPDGTGPVQAEGNEETKGKPEFCVVDESYFDDALFIGDSRVVGLRDYGRLKDHATFYAHEGLNVFKLLSKKIVEVPDQHKKISVEEALEQNQFGKIYLMVGINELDIGTAERFETAYREVVDRIRELQPDAKIYIQSIMLVTQKRAAKGDWVTNNGIIQRNERLQTIADDETVFYLDVNEAITDESGGMNPAYTSDGIHLRAKYVPLWTEYLKTHAYD